MTFPTGTFPDIVKTRSDESLTKHRESDNGWTVPLSSEETGKSAGKPRKEIAGVSSYERRDIEARFWSEVNKGGDGGCWLWVGSVVQARGGHGQFSLGRKHGKQTNVYAHRLSYELAYGPIPDGLNVCHHCDVARCVNPAHLFLGTQDDNLKDAARKKRFTVPHTKTLSLQDRLAIFHAPRTPRSGVELARRYGVTEAYISTIRKGRFVGAPTRHEFEPGPATSLHIRDVGAAMSVAQGRVRV